MRSATLGRVVGRPIALGPRLVALALLLYAGLVLLRMPKIVLKGRFWAEEGAVFFANAWTLDPLHALAVPVGGYLNLVANGATLAARWLVPVANAPYLTIAVALVFQLVPPLILLAARDAWLQPWPVRLAGVALLLVVPGSDEIWLQTLHCQFELTVACGLILALEVPRGGRMAFALGLLVLAPLCGPGAIALTPLFLLRALLDRTPGRALHFAALASGSAVQMIGFFSLGTDRGYTLDPGAILSVVTVKNLMVPFTGIDATAGRVAALQTAVAAGHVPLLAIAAPLVVFGGLTVVIWRAGNRPAFWLLAAAAAAALSAYIGALDGTLALIHPRAGARYAFVPLSLTALSVLALAAGRHPFWRWPAAAICAWLLIVGTRAYTTPWQPVSDGPSWHEQVALWHADPAYVMRLWPAPWTLTLPPE